MMYSLGKLQLDTIVLVDFFEVYTLYKTICILIGVFHCAKRILVEFMSPQIEVDHFHIIGIILSWKVCWFLSGVILMPLNQLGWMIHICWLF